MLSDNNGPQTDGVYDVTGGGLHSSDRVQVGGVDPYAVHVLGAAAFGQRVLAVGTGTVAVRAGQRALLEVDLAYRLALETEPTSASLGQASRRASHIWVR
jgi:hypothetical protein